MKQCYSGLRRLRECAGPVIQVHAASQSECRCRLGREQIQIAVTIQIRQRHGLAVEQIGESGLSPLREASCAIIQPHLIH